MNFDELEPEALWRYYQRGYHCLVRSGRYFRQILRPALSHVFFLRAMPLLLEYSRANRGQADLPPGFGDQMIASTLTARDLLHLDYAICLGFAESQGIDPKRLASRPVLDWPGPGGASSVFIAADALLADEIEEIEEEYLDDSEMDFHDEDDEDNGEPGPPFDL
jgi:hypothetical protein